MTHDELLTKIDNVFYEDEGGMQLDLTGFNNQYRAIRAVVELHNPQVSSFDDTECAACSNDELSVTYPCATTQVIHKELK